MEFTEYGPAVDEASVEEMCNSLTGGINKTVYFDNYSEDEFGLFLKLISVESDKPWLVDYRRNGSISEINSTTIVSNDWNENLESEQRYHYYTYQKTGMETGLLTLDDGALEIELTFDAYGNGYGDWNASTSEANITGWFYLNSEFLSDDHISHYDLNPARFMLDLNGSLYTESDIDYETGPTSIGILVTVNDDHGGFLSDQFTINVTDVFEDNDQDGIEDYLDPDDDNDGSR